MPYEISVTPRSNREAMISKRIDNSNELGEPLHEFRGETIRPKVISLPIDLPVYRLENCRTFSEQQTTIARECLNKDFFLKGQEDTLAQQKQHNILTDLAKQGNEDVTPIVKVLFEEGQRENLLVTSTGVVVNGNRRLSAMRELLIQAGDSIDSRFKNVKCAVLAPDVTRDEIDDIEADLQARRQTKLDYDWIGNARLIRRQVDKGRSTKEVAERLRHTKSEVENTLQALEEAELYLNDWIKRPSEYVFVRDGEQLFKDIPKNIAGKNTNLQNASRAIAWSIYEAREKISGRIYRLNPSFGKLAIPVLERLEDRLELELDESQNDDEILVDIDGGDSYKDYTPIIKALDNQSKRDENIEILLDVCESAIELDKGQKSEGAALTTLVQIHSRLKSIGVNFAGANTLTPMKKQIESIQSELLNIESSIDKRIDAQEKR